MAASASDHFKKLTNNFSTTLSSAIVGAGDSSMSLASTTNLPTDTGIVLVVDRVNSSGTATPTTREYVKGTVSGSNVINLVRGLGNSTAQAHSTGAVVEQVVDQNTINDLMDGILQDHDQSGHHKDLTDSNGNTWLKQSATSSAVNYLKNANAATGNGPTLSADGTDSNIDLNLAAKGTGQVRQSGRVDAWITGVPAPNTVTANGNRSYSLVFNSTDLTGYLSPGMRLRTTRTVAAPTQCTSLNGTTQFYSKTSPAGFAGVTNTFSGMGWIKPTSYQAGYLFARYSANGILMRMESDGRITIYGEGTGATRTTTSYQSVPLNKWTHVAATLQMSTGAGVIYFDGVAVPSTTTGAGTAIVQPTADLVIGALNGPSAFFPGKIAQVAIFSAVLSQATIQSYISQGLAGTETSLISAYSFNNSINDLNANANNLTANGSAVATNADSPFGGQADGTISSTLDYAIIQKAAFSTNTTLTVQVPEGCTVPTSGGVSAVSYSGVKVPYGFPVQKNKWLIQSLGYVGATQSSPVQNTWYNLNSQQINIPIGEWDTSYSCPVYGSLSPSTGFSVQATLSTANSTESDVETTAINQAGGASGAFLILNNLTKTKQLSIAAQATYYLNERTQNSGLTTLGLAGDVGRATINALCAYL